MNYWRNSTDGMEISVDDFEQIYKLNFDYLFRVVNSMIHDQDEAFNLVQNTFLLFLKKRDLYFPEQKAGVLHIRRWLRKAARNNSLAYLQREKLMLLKYRQVFYENPEIEITDLFGKYHAKPNSRVEQEYIQKETVEAVRKTLGTLPKHMFPVVLMKTWKSMPNDKIAESLGISKHRVMNRWYEAQTLLQTSLSCTGVDL
jgi:RNA polymerase sigma factor (sigma-70 family)